LSTIQLNENCLFEGSPILFSKTPSHCQAKVKKADQPAAITRAQTVRRPCATGSKWKRSERQITEQNQCVPPGDAPDVGKHTMNPSGV
jgi:hypothetical protein